jgi:N-methylhydantoinase A
MLTGPGDPSPSASGPLGAPDGRSAVGIDVGGTFTDVVLHDPGTGRLEAFKLPSTPDELVRAVVAALDRLRAGGPRIGAVVHGTTVATNAMLEGRTARTALITTRGFRDVLEIGRMHRENLYHLHDNGRPRPLVPRYLRFEVTERLDPRGNVLVPLATADLAPIRAALRAHGVEALAVCLLHSYANPAHERAVREALEPEFPFVSSSAEVAAEYREFERSNTVAANAALMPIVGRYVASLRAALEPRIGGPLHLVQSNGGMAAPGGVLRKPLGAIMSGPAAGIAASAYLLRRLGIGRAVTFDMGGTSTDVCLVVDGRASAAPQRRIAGHVVRLPSVNVESVGAGGGSVAWADAAGALKVGPRSAGADPGPACYGRGGTEPTVTDANLLLGYLDPRAVLGDAIRLDPEASARAIEPLARRYGLDLSAMAQGILEIANATMMRAIRLVSVQRGHDLRDFTLLAYGGAGPLHAGRLARLLHIPRVVVPILSGTFSALGCLVADVRYDQVRTFLSPLGGLDPARLAEAFGLLQAQAAEQLRGDGLDPAAVTWERGLDLRYVGQKAELEVACPPDPVDLVELGRRFNARHRMEYAYETPEEVECVNLRLAACLTRPHPDVPRLGQREAGAARAGSRPAFFPETGRIELPVYRRAALGAGDWIQGPAVVEEAWSTTLVYPGQRLEVDEHGNLGIEVGP